MHIDKNKLKNILNINDEDFKKTIAEAAKIGGIESDKVSELMNNAKDIKEKIGSISEQDLANMINAIGSDKLESLVKNIKNNK